MPSAPHRRGLRLGPAKAEKNKGNSIEAMFVWSLHPYRPDGLTDPSSVFLLVGGDPVPC